MYMHSTHLTQIGNVLFSTARHMISATCRTFDNVCEILYAWVAGMHVMSGAIKHRVQWTIAHTFVWNVHRATAIGEIVWKRWWPTTSNNSTVVVSIVLVVRVIIVYQLSECHRRLIVGSAWKWPEYLHIGHRCVCVVVGRTSYRHIRCWWWCRCLRRCCRRSRCMLFGLWLCWGFLCRCHRRGRRRRRRRHIDSCNVVCYIFYGHW